MDFIFYRYFYEIPEAEATPGGLLGSYDFSLSRVVEKIMNGELFKKNKEKEGADHE